MASEFVIDNSVVMSWCFDDEANGYADDVLDLLALGKAYVPAIWPLEVGNVLLVAERKGRLRMSDSIKFITLLTELPIIVEQETPERMTHEILSLARHHDLSTYDASYLDLALRKGLPIATQDRQLKSAAQSCQVALILSE